jgi:hypothetical protein
MSKLNRAAQFLSAAIGKARMPSFSFRRKPIKNAAVYIRGL